MAGGLIKVSCGSLVLDADARIEAKGVGSGSGGSINIQLKDGGTVTGSGVIDVGVTEYTGSHSFRRAGGGRAAVLDYGSITDEIVANFRMDGQKDNGGSGAGTVFHRRVCSTEGGDLIVRSTFKTSLATPIGKELDGSNMKWFCSTLADKSTVQWLDGSPDMCTTCTATNSGTCGSPTLINTCTWCGPCITTTSTTTTGTTTSDTATSTTVTTSTIYDPGNVNCVETQDKC